MTREIHIAKPYILEMPNKMTRLCAKTTWKDERKKEELELYYEVADEWAKYLVTEYSDSFVLALLENAMNEGYDIRFEQPLSEDLYYQLERFLIPTYARNLPMLKDIKLLGKTSREIVPTKQAVGTGFSAGVDSFHAILSNYNTIFTGHNVTHLLLCVNGSSVTGINNTLSNRWYTEMLHKTQPLADELGLKLIGVNSNIDILSNRRSILKGGDSLITSSFVHALRKLFGTYYWASTYKAEIVKFDKNDGGYAESLSLPWTSVQGLRFYHAGSETDRLGKVKMIADSPIVQKALTVCGSPNNCGRCFKCLRTMAELYSINKLEDFSEVFPIADFKKHLTFRLAEELAVDHPPFTTEIIEELKRNNRTLPFRIYILKYLYYKPLYFLKNKMRNWKWLMKIYYKYHLDIKVSGVAHDSEYIKARLEGKGK